jgi:Arc/MetJ-type ribon-helix-helix transcriptional regulator
MKTVTVKLPPEIDAALEAVSARRRVSKSVVLREALEAALAKEASKPSVFHLMQDSLGCIDSGVSDLATNPKHLEEGYGK